MDRVALSLALIAVFTLAPARVATAHETTTQGRLRVSVGWGEEPAYNGEMNSIEVEVSRVDGQPVRGKGSLTVELAMGASRLALPLAPDGPTGTFSARLIPTQAGTYSFHLTGTVDGQPIDIQSTCSETTFECVSDAGEIQFPTKEPSGSQVAARVDRELARANGTDTDDATARWLAVAAVILAGLALVVAISGRVQKGRQSA